MRGGGNIRFIHLFLLSLMHDGFYLLPDLGSNRVNQFREMFGGEVSLIIRKVLVIGFYSICIDVVFMYDALLDMVNVDLGSNVINKSVDCLKNFFVSRIQGINERGERG